LQETNAEGIHDMILAMSQVLGADRSTLYTVDQENREVQSVVAIGLEAGRIQLSMRRGLVGYVARTGETVMLKDAYNDPRFDRSVDQSTGYRTRSLLTMAIRGADGKVAGVLQALNKSSGAFTDADELTMQRYADEVRTLLGW
jgi:signal transduction protein with GAF and PtsI domain